ncbi:Chloroperoxidase [Dendryphion nanum]|uniref:Chloroperoxidase n=1 Tax=Dendryphion nanum TaxID=256645 RepID=A0A9P9INI1_9PLEO|nr:Chloroperoxidase [Dendryphion nanum]
MKIVPSLALLIGIAHAALNFTEWEHPPYGAVRSPCPALNAMANHGFIPRDGKNLTVPLLVQAMREVVNMSPEIATAFAGAGLRLAGPGATSFNMDHLYLHNGIEHDASLSREDFSVSGDSHSFSPQIFSEFISSFKGAKNIKVPEAAAARWDRVQTEKRRNPQFSYNPQNRFFSYGESALYLSLLNEPKSQSVPVEWLEIFFAEERFPYLEGWRTPQASLDGFSLSQNILLLSLATPEETLASVSARDLQDAHGLPMLSRA